MTTTRQGSGNRRPLPPDALKVCAECRQQRGTRRKDWVTITRDNAVVGYTCPSCPEWNEPIRREQRSDRVRFLVVTRDVNGRQIKTRHETLTEARAWLSERRAEVEDGREPERTNDETVAELVERWLASRVDVREVTTEGYAAVLCGVVRRIGDRPAAQVTVDDVQELVTWLSKSGGKVTATHPDGRPLAPRSVRFALIGLAQAFDLIHEKSQNPVRDDSIKKPRKVAKVGKDLEHWQSSELLQFVDHSGNDALAAAWRLTASGLTRADVLGHRWSDVDLDTGEVTVRQGRVAIKGSRETVIDEPKSPSRRRTVPTEAIYSGTAARLRSLKAKQAADRLAAGGAWHDSGLVVVNELGQPLRPERYSDRFKELCIAAGVPVIRLHSVRHSLAFWLHSLGVTPADAAAFLGHTVDVHLSTYLPESGNSGVARAALTIGQQIKAAASE